MRRRESEFVAYWKEFVLWEQASRSTNLGLDNMAESGAGADKFSGIVMCLQPVAEFFETAEWESKPETEEE